MATKRIIQDKQLTRLESSKSAFSNKIQSAISKGEEIAYNEILNEVELDRRYRDFNAWNDYNSELLKQSFNNEQNEYKRDYDDVNKYYGLFGVDNKSRVQKFKEQVENKLQILRQILAKVELMKSVEEKVSINHTTSISTEVTNNNIFIVHGHNSEVKVTVARTLEKLGLNPIILHEQANSGGTIIEKFEKHSNVGYAIVLLTDDDLGKAKNDEALKARARQNVIFELGYFIGKLGREKVCTLYTKDVEVPSDLSGFLHIEIDSKGYWKFDLGKELKAIGYQVDLNHIP